MAGGHGCSLTSTVQVLLGVRGIFQASHDELPVIDAASGRRWTRGSKEAGMRPDSERVCP